MPTEPDLPETTVPPKLLVSIPWYVVALAGVIAGVCVAQQVAGSVSTASSPDSIPSVTELLLGVAGFHGAAAAAIVAVVVVMVPRGDRLAALQLQGFRWWWLVQAAGRVLIIVPVIIAVNIGCYSLYGRFVAQPEMNPMVQWVVKGPPSVVAVVCFTAVLVAPFCEELLFRNVLHRVFERALGTVPATIGASLCFAAVHMIPPEIAPLFLLGVTFQVVRNRSGSLWPAMLLHSLFNGSIMVFVLLARLLGGAPPPGI